MGLCRLSWDSTNLGEFADISRFGESNSRLAGQKFPISRATGIRSQTIDSYWSFEAERVAAAANFAIFPLNRELYREGALEQAVDITR
jgi:hypothetical protein